MESFVVLIHMRLPLWLYLCTTFVATFVLSFVASGGLKKLVSFPEYGDGHVILRLDRTWYSVVSTICAIGFSVVMAGAIMRHRLMVQTDADSPRVREEARIVKVERAPDVMA